MRLTERSILKNKFFIIVVMLLLLYPKMLDYSGGIISSVFQRGVRYLPYTFFPLFIIIFWNVNRDAHKLYWLLFGFRLFFLIPDILYGVEFSEIKISIKNTIWIVMGTVSISAMIKSNAQKFINLTKCLCNLFVVINLFFQFVFPEGIAKIEMLNTEYNVISWSDAVNFIDVDNRLSLFMILAIYVNILFQYSKYGKIKKYFWILLPILNIFIAWSGTGLLAMTCLGIYLFYSRNKVVNKLVSGLWVFGIYAAILIIFVVFQKFRVFELLIVNVLHKNMSLSNRTTIWAYYVGLILQKSILGYGTANNGGLFNWNGQIWYAHNQILDLLVQGGICVLILFIIVIVMVKKHVERRNALLINGLFSICLLSYFVVGIAEHFLVTFNMCFFVFLAIAYNSNFFFQREKENF